MWLRRSDRANEMRCIHTHTYIHIYTPTHTASLEAAGRGARVTLLDKCPSLGGNSAKVGN